MKNKLLVNELKDLILQWQRYSDAELGQSEYFKDTKQLHNMFLHLGRNDTYNYCIDQLQKIISKYEE